MREQPRHLERVWAAVFLVPSIALLVVAARLEPAEAGVGTHRQLGMATCSWIAQGRGPCPTCGMTTAFALAADGRLLASFHTQPAAALGAILTAMTAWVAGYTLVTGSPVARDLKFLLRPATLGVALAILMAAWAYKIVFG